MRCRPGLASSAAHVVVQRWVDDAVEELSNMMYTCSLDVMREYQDGLSESSVASCSASQQVINAETRAALIKFRDGLRKLALEAQDL